MKRGRVIVAAICPEAFGSEAFGCEAFACEAFLAAGAVESAA
jgi:hypothetical protein